MSTTYTVFDHFYLRFMLKLVKILRNKGKKVFKSYCLPFRCYIALRLFPFVSARQNAQQSEVVKEAGGATLLSCQLPPQGGRQ